MQHKARRARLRKERAGLLVAGLSYALFVWATDLYLPCPFRALTGLLCPACGVTHAVLALLRLDLTAAFAWNPFLVLAAPVILLLLAWRDLTWLRTGREPDSTLWKALLWGTILAALVWGVARNCAFVSAFC